MAAFAVDSLAGQRDGCVWSGQTMAVETKFLRLYQPATLGEQIDGWKVCWLGQRPAVLLGDGDPG